jgi:PAS domain S-box-containing protein
LFEAYPDGVLLVDRAGRIALGNQAAASLLGLDAKALVGMSVDQLVPDSVRQRHVGLRHGYGLAPKPRPMGSEMELTARRGDGSEVKVEIALSPLKDGDAAYVVVSIRGIDAYPRVRRALQRARYSEFIAQVGRVAADTRDPRELLNCVPAFAARALEVESVEVWLLETNPSEFRIASSFGVQGLVEQAVANRPDTLLGFVAAQAAPLLVTNFQRESRFTVPADWRDGPERSGLAVPLIDTGRTIGVLLARSIRAHRFAEDEQKFLEALGNLLVTSLQRAQTEAQLNHAQRMESVGQLTGGIAHDFNNLLTVIQGNLQMLAEHAEVSGNQACLNMVNAAARAGQRGAELTSKLLAFSRRQTLAAGPVDVRAMLESLVDMLGRTIGERIRIELQSIGPCPRALADAGQLESALLNIAINARDAMPEGGELVFTCALCEAPHEMRQTGVEAGPCVSISVRDTGAGMSQAVIDRAFEPFFTTKDSGKGTGLGLSTVYGFIKQSKGHIRIDSAQGQGTTITLFLPGALSIAAAAPETGTDAAPAALLRRVLLVEDDEGVREVALGFLSSLGCEVSPHASAESALNSLVSNQPFDLLFTDITLGSGLSGTELAARAQALRPGLLVLLTSGYSRYLADESADQPRRWPLLKKPYSREALAQAMAALAA